MIGTILTIWFVLMGIYYLCAILLHLAVKLPAIIAFVVCLPAMPFIVARRNRKEHPVQAKALCWMTGILYALLALILLVDGHL